MVQKEWLRQRQVKQKFIGSFDLGWETVDLIAILDDIGGCFYFQPEPGKVPRIKVGLDYEKWSEVVSTLLHETFEFVLAREGLRFVACRKFNNDHADYLFAFDHPAFSRICSNAALFVTEAMPKLAAAYNLQRKKKKKNK